MAMPEVRTGADGLPVTVVGAWTLEKHERLVKYVDITKARWCVFQMGQPHKMKSQ
jgi:hypothetical protein